MNLSYRLGHIFLGLLYRLLFRYRAYHPERVPATGGVILAANHVSFLDPPLIGLPLRRPLSYLARKSLFRNRLIGALLRSWQAVPVDRDGGGAAGLKAILDRLRRGDAILLFPEGTRSPDGTLQPPRSGIGLAIIKSDCPVVPVRVFGTYEAWGRHQRWPRPRPIAVAYGEPMDFAELRAEAKTASRERLKAIYQEAAEAIMAAIARLEPRD